MSNEKINVITARVKIRGMKPSMVKSVEEIIAKRTRLCSIAIALNLYLDCYPEECASILAESVKKLKEESPQAYECFQTDIGEVGRVSSSPQEGSEADRLFRFHQEAMNTSSFKGEMTKKDILFLSKVITILSREITEDDTCGIEYTLRVIKLHAINYLIQTKSSNLKSVADRMTDIYRQKNADYGNSFDKSLDEDGLLVAKIRIGDKINRICSLLNKEGEAKVKDESLEDTLLDLANYCVMTILWIERKEEQK